MAKKGIECKIGDVFRIKATENQYGFGQIIAVYAKSMLLIVIYSYKSDSCIPSIPLILQSAPLFIAISMDGKLWHGDWEIIGNVPPDLKKIKLPNYIIQKGNEVYIEDFYAKKSRVAREEEIAVLRFRRCSSPQILEDALKAIWGFAPWKDIFDALKAENVLATANIKI